MVSVSVLRISKVNTSYSLKGTEITMGPAIFLQKTWLWSYVVSILDYAHYSLVTKKWSYLGLRSITCILEKKIKQLLWTDHVKLKIRTRHYILLDLEFVDSILLWKDTPTVNLSFNRFLCLWKMVTSIFFKKGPLDSRPTGHAVQVL